MIGTAGEYRIFRVSKGAKIEKDVEADLGKREDLCREAVSKKLPVYAVYLRGELKACYAFQQEGHELKCGKEWTAGRLPSRIQSETDLCICRDLISILAWKNGWSAEFHGHAVTVKRSALILQILEGIAFGAAMGLILWLALKRAAVSALIGCAWAAANIMLFLNHEIEKQKDQVQFHEL